jgi:hypothetical protein
MTISSPSRSKTLIAIAVLLYGMGACELLGENSPPVMPGDLRGQCAVIEGDVLMDDYESTHLTLADEHGKELYFSYGGSNGDRIRYGNRETGWVQSKPGGDQEMALLKILRQTRITQFTPPPPGSGREHWSYLALKHSLFALEYRCRHKTAIIPWRVVSDNWTFGGTK